MALLGVPAGWAMSPLGTSWSELHARAPALMLLGMAVTMTVPMVAWMRYRGHGWQANTEMSAAMFLPTFAVIALLGGGLVEDIGNALRLRRFQARGQKRGRPDEVGMPVASWRARVARPKGALALTPLGRAVSTAP
jgi:hypothetical protein